MFVIGVTGYCHPTKFNREEAWHLLEKAFNEIANKNKNEDILVLGGLTDIPSVHQAAYYMARQREWNVGGIACEKAKAFKWFPMSTDGDTLAIVGETWGDESKEFVSRCDALIRIGGGKHAHNESEMAKAKGILVIEKEIK